MIFEKCTLKIHALWRITSNIQASGITTIFWFRYQSLTWQCSGLFCLENLFPGCNCGINFVVILKYSFSNFVQMPNKYLRFRRFRRSYVNHSVVAPTNCCQIFTSFFFFFLLDVWCSKLSQPIFCGCFPIMIVHLHNLFFLSTPVAWMFLTPRWVSRREVVK